MELTELNLATSETADAVCTTSVTSELGHDPDDGQIGLVDDQTKVSSLLIVANVAVALHFRRVT